MKQIKQTLLVIGCVFGLAAKSFAASDLTRVWVESNPGGLDKAETVLLSAGAQIHYRFDDLNALAVSVPSAALPGLSRNPNIALIEKDAKRFASAQQIPYGIDAVQARDVWDSDRDGNIDNGAPTGSGRMICVIDSGVKINHDDFAGVNFAGGYPTGWNMDTCGHGTHVTGTIVAANNDAGVVGATPEASIYMVKVFDGPDCGWTYSSDLVDAAQHCEAAGANIISMSLGGNIRSRTEQKAFDQLDRAGILSIAAAGNDGNNTKSYPASYNAVVSVAAVDSNNVVADFSQQNSSVELAAPGVGVLSTLPWLAVDNISVDGVTYEGRHIANSANGSASGTLVNGGLCDSTGSWSGQIVLCERGSISFYDKVSNVQNSGGLVAVIYNNVSGSFSGTLGDGNSSSIPTISLGQEDGQILVTRTGLASSVTSTFTADASGYEAWDGTSMATPHVSAVAALVWSSSPGSSNAEIRNILDAAALDLGSAGRDNAYGYGLVQAHAAWLALGGEGGDTNQTPTSTFTYSCSDLACAFDASGSSDPDGSITSYSWNFGDGNSASDVSVNHTYASAGSYTVTLTVTDNSGASDADVQPIAVTSSGSSGDTIPPVISAVAANKTKGVSLEITWTTDEPATSKVTFTCCGDFTDPALVTAHSMAFRGSKGTSYEFWVSSTDGAGNSSTDGPFNFQN
jgi:serine protease